MIRVIHRKAARIGASFLDKCDPDWFKDNDDNNAIDLDKLDLEEGPHCVLGQRYGDYDRGVEKLDLDWDDKYTYGFMAEHHDENVRFQDWAQLTAAWKQEIRKRIKNASI